MGFQPNGTLVVPGGVGVALLADPTTTGLQKHKPASGNLFTRQPCKEDVVQGQIGDCYLLAAINSILTRPEGPEIIQAIFRDSGDGTVIIRLYKGGAYHYLRMNKTLVREYEGKTLGIRHGTGKVLHGQGALWVSLLEKAYTSFMRTQPPGQPTMYKHLEGGAGKDAMAAIVGGGDGIVTGGALAEVSEIRDTLFALTEECSTANNLFKMVPALKAQILTKIANGVFAEVDDNQQHANNWLTWNTAVQQAEFRLFNRSNPSRDTFRKVMEKISSGLNPTTLKLVMVWVERYAPELWPGEVGSAEYTSEQLNLFMKIQRLLATQRGVVAATMEKLAGPVAGAGHSGGEPMVSGLAGKHAYTVLDTKTDALGRRYFLVRNPWGEYGRTYQTESRSSGQKGPALLKPVANEKEAESWIELTDFSRNFTTIGASPAVHGEKRQAFMSELKTRLDQVKAGNKGLNRLVDL